MKRNKNPINSSTPELVDRVIQINRVSKVVKGGRRFSFSALAVVGDGKGRVGWGHGKANEVPEAIRKALERAKAEMIDLPLLDGTLPHAVLGHFGAARIVMKPASPGTGVIAGGALRPILEVAGIHDVLTKILGSRNPHNVIKAAFQGFSQFISADEACRRRGLESGYLSYPGGKRSRIDTGSTVADAASEAAEVVVPGNDPKPVVASPAATLEA